GAQRRQTIGVVAEMQVGTEGTGDEPDPLLDRRRAEVADAQVEQLRETGAACLLGTDGEHPLGGVDADHADAGRRDRNRNPSGADAELDYRAARPNRLVD